MKRILFVDDDPIVVRIYQEALSRRGFQVDVAQDGLAATKALRANKPDLMVLDLMMPKLSGVDVLKFTRSQPGLADLPVIVLSNSYMSDLVQGAAAAGAQKALLKVRCTPSILAGVIGEVLEGQPAKEEGEPLIAAANAQPTMEQFQQPVAPAQSPATQPPVPAPSPVNAPPLP